ncbi:UNVERIFIED_CONTAM: hypothetical protein RMT77_014902 [Armadillidium vulgare]
MGNNATKFGPWEMGNMASKFGPWEMGNMASNSESKLLFVNRHFLVKGINVGRKIIPFEGINITEKQLYCNPEREYVKKVMDNIAKSHQIYVDKAINLFKESVLVSTNKLFFSDVYKYFNKIMMYLLKLKGKKREIYYHIVNYKLTYGVLKFFLLLPYQDLFLPTLYEFFQDLDGMQFYRLLHDIVDLLEDQKFSEPLEQYNLFIKQIWLKSPSYLKKFVLDAECRKVIGLLKCKCLIERLFLLKNLTSANVNNIRLILKYATSQDKKDILKYQGQIICRKLIFDGNFRLAECFIELFNLNEDDQRKFKKGFAFQFFERLMRVHDLNLIVEVAKWAVGTNEADKLIRTIFFNYYRNIVVLVVFSEIEGDFSFDFITALLKLVLKTDEKIEKWKKAIVHDYDFIYSPELEFTNLKWFDKLLEFIGYSEEEASEVKKSILLKRMRRFAPYLPFSLLKCSSVEENLFPNILFFCSYNKVNIYKFTDILRDYYKDSINEDLCLICEDGNHVSKSKKYPLNSCQIHKHYGMISLLDVDLISYSFSKQINNELLKPEYKIKTS